MTGRDYSSEGSNLVSSSAVEKAVERNVPETVHEVASAKKFDTCSRSVRVMH